MTTPSCHLLCWSPDPGSSPTVVHPDFLSPAIHPQAVPSHLEAGIHVAVLVSGSNLITCWTCVSPGSGLCLQALSSSARTSADRSHLFMSSQGGCWSWRFCFFFYSLTGGRLAQVTGTFWVLGPKFISSPHLAARLKCSWALGHQEERSHLIFGVLSLVWCSLGLVVGAAFFGIWPEVL